MREIIIVEHHETWWQSVSRDVVTFLSCAGCLYLSEKSNFWFYLTAFFAVAWLFGKFANARNRVFDNKHDLIGYLNTLNDVF